MIVRHGNGILVEMDGRRFRFDPGRLVQGDVCMISHAHTDHIPSGMRHREALCSEITREFVQLRRGKELSPVTDDRVEVLDAGHIPGSSMFLVSGERTVLYTGDLCTRDRECMKGARPVKCDVLVIEATYGQPHYVFPDHREVIAAARDWLEDLLAEGRCAILYAYPLGKSQELAAAFRDLPLAMSHAVAENNALLNRHGFDLPVQEHPGPRHDPFVYITSGPSADRERVDTLVRNGARTASFTGWALDRAFQSRSGAFKAFPVSDHCGFDELLGFVDACGPEVVYTVHGFTHQLASHIRKDLGIDAQPLVRRQGTLDQFC
jgi:putative mRNA 3-end processing factor